MGNGVVAGVSAGLVFASLYCMRSKSAKNAPKTLVRAQSKMGTYESTTESKVEVIISDPDKFDIKKRKLVSDGMQNLQVIADFDRTLTSCTVNGKRGAGCHGIVESLEVLSSEYRDTTAALFQKYYPIEICHELTIEQKLPLMVEWYSTAHSLLLKEKVTEEHIRAAVQVANCDLRPKVREIVALLQSWEVPLLIFSAGIANVIQEVMLQKFGPLTGSTHVISNWILFDKSGEAEGFSEPLIHMFNKNESQTRETDFHKAVEERGNVILLGDGLGDVTMADGIPHDNVLKIGFLNEKVDDLLPKFKEVYDVIITNDGSMEFVVELLESIVKKSAPSST